MSESEEGAAVAAPRPGPEFTKIAFAPKQKRVRLEYTVGNGSDEPDEYTVTTRQPPHADLVEALGRLRKHALALCELDRAVPEGEIEVRGVSIRWKDGAVGATITALRQLKTSAAPLVLNTPFKFEGDDNAPLPQPAVDAIRALVEEAALFLEGKRGEDDGAEESDQEEMELGDGREESALEITVRTGGAEGQTVRLTGNRGMRPGGRFVGNRGRGARR
jgi:hypothetical protein